MHNTQHTALHAHQPACPVQAMLTSFTILIERTLDAAVNTALQLMLLQNAPRPLRARAPLSGSLRLSARRGRS